MVRIIRPAIAALAIGLVIGAAAPAMAAGPSAPVVTSGTCSAGSTWQLTVKRDSPGMLEADLEVHTGAAGQRWHNAFRDNGTLFARGAKTTQADGSFSITRLTTDQSGSDHIKVRSTNGATGEICVAKATY